MRDVFGNPFRPVPVSPEWRTDTVVSLARQMYESRDFSAMPILADALQDAGCDNDDILTHCRGLCRDCGLLPPWGGRHRLEAGRHAEPHVRGCWCVDLLLGKE